MSALYSLRLQSGKDYKVVKEVTGKLQTLIYVDVPTNVSAIELISSPDTPKSQILISPLELHRIFEGLMSASGISKIRYDDEAVRKVRGQIT